MNGALKIISFMVAALFLAGGIALGVTAMNKGKAGTEQAMQSIDKMTDGLKDSEYKVYVDTKLKGSYVVDAIGLAFKDDAVEVLVSTKDGQNLVYNGGANAVPFAQELTGMPSKDAAGGKFANIAMATTTLGSTGYEPLTTATTPGFIYDGADFYGTAQYDVNGMLRRITFVQQ